MPLPTSNPGVLITTVGGIHAFRIALYANSIAALPAGTYRSTPRWVVVENPRAKVHEQWV